MKKSKIIIKEYGKDQLEDELEELDEMLQEAEADINRQKDYEKSRPYKGYKDRRDDDYDDYEDDNDDEYDNDEDGAASLGIKKHETKKAPRRTKVVVSSADMYISTASKVALILSILGITFLPGGTLAVLDLCSKDPYRKKWMSWLSLYISVVWLISIILVSTGHGWVK